MIQNMLIGIVAFLIAVYWVTRVETRSGQDRPNAMEIWRRFPKFILGFVAASVVFSLILTPVLGQDRIDAIIDVTSDCRGWLFCLAFVSIGLASRFRELGSQLTGGRPIHLYVTGQAFNLVLTLMAAYLAFGGILFERVAQRQPDAGIQRLVSGRDATALFHTELAGWNRYSGSVPSAGRNERQQCPTRQALSRASSTVPEHA